MRALFTLLLLCVVACNASIVVFPIEPVARRLDTCDDEAEEVEGQITTCDATKQFQCECTKRGFATDELTCLTGCETCIVESRTCHRNRALYFYNAFVGVNRINQCIEYTLGDKQTVCLDQRLGSSESCTMSLGSTTCDSCKVNKSPNDPCVSLCWEIDCTNISGAGTYNTCTGDIETNPDSPFFEIFYSNFNEPFDIVCPGDSPVSFPSMTPPTPPPTVPITDPPTTASVPPPTVNLNPPTPPPTVPITDPPTTAPVPPPTMNPPTPPPTVPITDPPTTATNGPPTTISVPPPTASAAAPPTTTDPSTSAGTYSFSKLSSPSVAVIVVVMAHLY